MSSDKKNPAVEQNLQRAQGKWGQLANILVREGADRITVGSFYVAVVKAVLLSGSDTWVLSPCLDKSLKVFHHQVVRRMAGMGPKRQQDSTWVYTHIGVTLKTLGLEEIGLYIVRYHNMAAYYIATRPIMNLCLAPERNPVLHLSMQWCEHPAMDILGIREGHAAEEGGEETLTEESEGW